MTETRLRISQVGQAYEKTFHWLFEPSTVSFNEWLRGTQGPNGPIFWIQGKPGSGKSTLMKFAMRDSRTLELLGNERTWKLIAFFFHDRGSSIQRSLDGMMQEILHSILLQHPPMQRIITSTYLELVKSQRTKFPKWDTLTLKTALLTVARVNNPRVGLCIFLDALDEHGGDNEALAALVKEIVNQTNQTTVQIKVCVASRSWPIFTEHFGACPGFAIHEHTLQDIRIYTQNRLTGDRFGSQSLLDSSQIAAIAAQVTKKASGVFIWVRLVVDQLSKDIRDGTPFRDLENRVMEMPPELEELYAHTLRRIDPAYSDEAYIMLQIAFCSLSPLSLATFLACTSYNQRYLYSPPTSDVDTRDTEEASPDSQLRRLASRSGGLLESIARNSPNTTGVEEQSIASSAQFESMGDQLEPISVPTGGFLCVQFIHQTVKDYVGKYEHALGLINLTSDLQRLSGYYCLINPTPLPITIHTRTL